MILTTNKSAGLLRSTLLFALILAPASAWSQEEYQGESLSGQGSQVEVSADEIIVFAKAQHQVDRIREEFNERLPNAQNSEEQQRIVQEANDKMVNAIQDQGLTVERYNTILTAAQSDPELQNRILQAMQSLQ